jgi:hypothetical protein
MSDTINNDMGIEEELMEKQLSSAPNTSRKGVKAPAAAKVADIDPEDDRENWPTIQVETEDNKENYAFLAVSGTKADGKSFTHQLQVQRGVDVKVPPSVVNMLKTTKQTIFRQVEIFEGGAPRMKMVRQDRPSIPWQLISGGKYCK